jgi:serine/threonine protein kinase
MRLARKIAEGLNYLHENNICHLHLSSKNIYIQETNDSDENFIPLIADYGFHYLKEISSVFIKYKNKNSYSSPEILKDGKNIGNYSDNKQISFQNDVYSFGLILWELYTLLEPFNISLNNVYNYVVINNCRPEITKDFNSDVASLIRLCWDIDSKKRPTFKKIIEILNNSKII